LALQVLCIRILAGLGKIVSFLIGNSRSRLVLRVPWRAWPGSAGSGNRIADSNEPQPDNCHRSCNQEALSAPHQRNDLDRQSSGHSRQGTRSSLLRMRPSAWQGWMLLCGCPRQTLYCPQYAPRTLRARPLTRGRKRVNETPPLPSPVAGDSVLGILPLPLYGPLPSELVQVRASRKANSRLLGGQMG